MATELPAVMEVCKFSFLIVLNVPGSAQRTVNQPLDIAARDFSGHICCVCKKLILSPLVSF